MFSAAKKKPNIRTVRDTERRGKDQKDFFLEKLPACYVYLGYILHIVLRSFSSFLSADTVLSFR